MTKDINKVKLPENLSGGYYGGLSNSSIGLVPIELLDIDEFSTGLLKKAGINTLSDILNMPQVLNMNEEKILDNSFPFSEVYKSIQKKYGPLDQEDSENIHTKKVAACKKVLADLALSKAVIETKEDQLTKEYRLEMQNLKEKKERLLNRIKAISGHLEEELNNPYWNEKEKIKK